MQKRLGLLLLLLALVPPTRGAAQDLTAKVDEYLASLVSARRFSGAVLLARDGKVLTSKGYGMASFELGVPNTPQTRFRLGSVTKQFTAMAILLLQKRGKLKVQDPISKYLEDCPEAWKAITIHHLLTHTSGIPNFTAFPDYVATMPLPSPAALTLKRFRDKPLEFKPGERFSYSNSGYVLLGHLVERVSGKPYEAFLREAVFKPLGMEDTGYDNPREILRNRAAGYTGGGEGLVNAPYIDMTVPGGAGALYSTVEDLYRWDQALYTDKLLPSSLSEAMFTPALDGYAYGWQVKEESGRKSLSHGGGINGFLAYIARYPEQRATVIVLSNIDTAPVATIARDLTALLFGEKYELPRERREAKVDPQLYDEYAGEYELAPGLTVVLTREGDRLMVQAMGQPKEQLFPESETSFFLKTVDAQISFVREEGKVARLILHQGGRDVPARKVK